MINNLKGKKVQIRNAQPQDAETMCRWYSDPRIMIHVGFSNGLSVNPDELIKNLSATNNLNRIFVILDELNNSIGECNYKKR